MNLKEYKEFTGMTQQELAEFLDISRSGLSNYLNGNRTPDSDICLKIIEKTRGMIKLQDLIKK